MFSLKRWLFITIYIFFCQNLFVTIGISLWSSNFSLTAYLISGFCSSQLILFFYFCSFFLPSYLLLFFKNFSKDQIAQSLPINRQLIFFLAKVANKYVLAEFFFEFLLLFFSSLRFNVKINDYLFLCLILLHQYFWILITPI